MGTQCACTPSAPQTWLSYELFEACAGETVGFGWASISNAALKVGNNAATLNLRVATTATSYTEGPTGAIVLTFTPNGAFEYSYAGQSTAAYPGGTVKAHGSWSYRTAAVSGTVLTASIDSGFGESRDKQIEFERVLHGGNPRRPADRVIAWIRNAEQVLAQRLSGSVLAPGLTYPLIGGRDAKGRSYPPTAEPE